METMTPAEKLFTEFWEWRLQQTPEFATFTGDKRYNGRLEAWTEARFQEDNNTCTRFLERAGALLERAGDEEERLNLQFLMSELGIFVAGHQHGGYFFPLNYMEGPHVDFQRLAEWATPTSVRDFQDIIERYNKFPAFIRDIIATMRSGIAKKMTCHSVSVKGVMENCKNIANEAAEGSDFYKPFLDLPCGTDEEKQMLQQTALEAINKCLKAGFSELAEFLEQEYLAACRPEIAATSLPAGEEFYRACLRFHTTTDLTADQIHELGLQEVARIEAEMRDIIRSLGREESLKDFIQSLRTDSTHYYQSAEELLAAGRDIVFTQIYPRLPQLFTAVPRTKLEINSTPSGEYPAGFYMAGTEDGSRPGKYSLNTFKFDSQPKYEMISLSLHEACPGHHLQGSYLLEKKGVPQFR